MLNSLCKVLIAFILFSVHSSKAQDTIRFINGKEIIGKVLNCNSDNISIEIQKRGKTKLKKISYEGVFSVSGTNCVEKIFYKQDSLTYFSLTPEQMKYFIQGEQFAIKNYYSKPVTFGGILSGVAGSALGFFSLPIPAVYAFFVTIKSPTLDRYKDLPENLKNNHYFILGFKKKSNLRKINNALISGYSTAVFTIIVLSALSL